MRDARWVGAGLLIAMFAAAPAAAGAATVQPKRIRAAAAFSLQPSKRCVRGRSVKVKLRKLRRVHWLGAVVSIDGTRVKKIKRKQIGRRIKLAGLPDRKFVLRIVATARDGRKARAIRKYAPCAPKGGPGPSPQPGPAPGPPAGASPTPGSYSGRSGQGHGFDFYVSGDGSHVQDVSILTDLGCSPSRNFSDHVGIADIPIAADGSFTATTHQDGVVAGAPARFTYTFSGHFDGTDAAGTVREDISFDNGIAYSCTTNDQSWTAGRDTQGTQAVAPAPGSYSGRSWQGHGFDFYVSTDGKQIEDVSILTDLGCSPSRNLSDHIGIAEIPIAADGSFTATTHQDGVVAGVPARFTYTYSGHFHGTDTAGTVRVAGNLREDISFDNGTAFSCTTNDQTWFASRDTQGTQAVAPAPGSYSGRSWQGHGFDFYVSTDGKQIEDVSILTDLGCSPSRNLSDHIGISAIPIAADGSFTATTTQDGIASGAPARFTYTFSGHFHGSDTAGTGRVAGNLREDITFDNGTAYSCTTDDQTWFASRDTQGTQAVAPAPGSYAGRSWQGHGFSFNVSPGGTEVRDVSILTDLGCSPSRNLSDHIGISAIPIAADGSFSAVTEQDGLVGAAPAHFTYTFSGHFHGTDTAGTMRAAGTLREDITFNDGTAYSCTTNDQTWFASH